MFHTSTIIPPSQEFHPENVFFETHFIDIFFWTKINFLSNPCVQILGALGAGRGVTTEIEMRLIVQEMSGTERHMVIPKQQSCSLHPLTPLV